MSHLNSVNPAPQNVNFRSEDQPIAAEWVTTGENEDDYRPLVGLRRLLPPTEEETTGEELQATDAIAFNFLQIPPSSSPKTSLAEDPAPRPWGKLSPTLISGLACFIVANGLLLWHQGTSSVNHPSPVTNTNIAPTPPQPSFATTAPTTPKKLTLANLSELPPPAPPQQTLLPASQAITSLNTVKPTAKPLPAYQAIESLESSPPRVRNALSELLLPPSLQPQMVYSNALPPGSPYPPGRTVSLPAIAVRPPQPKPLPPTSYRASLQPQGTVSLPSRILPPPPPVSVNSMALPAAPPMATNTVPATVPASIPATMPATVPAQTTVQTNPPSPVQPNGYTTDQMLRQTLNQQNQMEIEAYQQANTPFQQKVKQKLQPLMPQIQSVQSGETPPPGDTQGLVEQLQRLNQAE